MLFLQLTKLLTVCIHVCLLRHHHAQGILSKSHEFQRCLTKRQVSSAKTLSTCMIIRYKHTFNNMFDNKVATKIARIWNPLQLCGNPFRAFRLNFIMVNCKNCMACSCNQTVYHPINYSSSDIFNILSRQVL